MTLYDTGDSIGFFYILQLFRKWLLYNLLLSRNLKQILIKVPQKGVQLHFPPLTSVQPDLLWSLTEHEKFLSLLSQPSCLLLSGATKTPPPRLPWSASADHRDTPAHAQS